jgi:uncharacterized protein (TIGR00296 family)
VTWKKKICEQFTLRGCIGTFNALPLVDGLRQFAIKSAFSDSRFGPIRKDEVEQLQCGVSALIQFEKRDDLYDWEIGIHGIQIEFDDHLAKCRRRATYLPEVCADQGWSHAQCIESLYRKAGYKGSINEFLLQSTSISRYQSAKVYLEYHAYQSMRD